MESKKGKRCYIYTRVSTAMQVEGYSLEAQEKKLLEYAKLNEMTVVRKYCDEGKSGKSTCGRPEFLKMMDDIDTGKDAVSYVLVFKLSRFGRNTKDVLVNLEAMQANDVNLICVEDGIDSSNEAGKLIISVLASVAEIERENISVQTLAGRREKASKGLWNGGKAPYGYKLVKGKGTLEIKEDEAEIVRVIFHKYVYESLSADKISEHLNSRYKRVPIQKHDLSLFTASFVRKILDNDTYAGYITYGKTKGKVDKRDRSKTQRIKSEDYIKVNGTHEPLISQDVWTIASSRRQESKQNNVRNKNRESDHIYPLTGLIICPECGTPLNGFSSNKQNKNKGGMYKTTYAYKCRNNKTQRGHICSFNRQLNEEAMCNEVILMLNKLATIDEFTNMVAEKLGAGVDLSNLEEELKLYEKNKAKAKRNVERLGIDIDNLDCNDDAYKEKLENMTERWDAATKQESEFNKKIDEIRRRIKAAKEKQLTRENIITILSNFKVWYNEMNDDERKKLLHELIERIEIRSDLGEGKSGRLDYSSIIEKIVLAIPVSINGELSEIYLTKENTVETVVFMSRGGVEAAT